jgi:integrase/recombinase XerD
VENSSLINEFYEFMKYNNSSERHIINNLKVIINFDRFFKSEKRLKDIKRQDITTFLDSKIKSSEIDPEKKWITTWNHYFNHLKFFYRWLYNDHDTTGNDDDGNRKSLQDWNTPAFLKIKLKKTKRLSPYSQNEIWDKDELLTIIKYETYKRNKAALALFWDLDARNHEITLLKIKNIQLKEKYGEGEVPHEAKTGSGPILLTLSFPYVRDWLNEHPFKNELEARIICNLITGAPIKSDAMWTMMKQLKKRIKRLLEKGEITNNEEKEKLEHLLKTKKWNPYCIRHSAITADSDYLPEYALKKKVRWSMNSKQGSRYIKKRMGNELKSTILEYNGISIDPLKIQKHTVSN